MPAPATMEPPLRAALLCIDMQNDFCLPEATLCVKGAMGCLPHVIEAVDAARRNGVPVVWVVREHHYLGERGGGRHAGAGNQRRRRCCRRQQRHCSAPAPVAPTARL